VNVFFDVQGTLISGGRPRPLARDVFAALVDEGHHVYLWSTAGPSYARSAAKILGVEDLIVGYYGKHDHLPVTVDFVVYDRPGMAERYGGYTVSAFTGDPEDRELLSVPEAVEATEPEERSLRGLGQ
jgi:hypothetical protein